MDVSWSAPCVSQRTCCLHATNETCHANQQSVQVQTDWTGIDFGLCSPTLMTPDDAPAGFLGDVYQDDEDDLIDDQEIEFEVNLKKKSKQIKFQLNYKFTDLSAIIKCPF